MSARPIIVVLGSFLECEWFDLWQRQQEFTSSFMGCGDVLYVERAAGGKITPGRVLGRIQKLMGKAAAPVRTAESRPTPEFVKWVQLPLGGRKGTELNARRVVDTILTRCRALGAEKPDFVYVSTPSEVWAETLKLLDVPYWYDMPERYLASAQYASVDRAAMRWMVSNALLATVDTQVGFDDWRDIRDDILIVEHGAKPAAEEPDWSTPRARLYYVGSVNPAVDIRFIDVAANAFGENVRVIGEGEPSEFGSRATVLGWMAGDAIPRVLSDAVAGLVPYVLDEFTAGVLPTKIYDYFLAGAPVIASALPSLRGHFGVIVSDGSEESMAAAIAQARAMSLEERRALRSYAVQNTWPVRFAVVRRELERRGLVLDG